MNGNQAAREDAVQERPGPQPGRHRRIHLVDVPNRNYEPKRDWRLGIITGHRTRIAVVMISVTIGLYLFQNALWPRTTLPHGVLQDSWSWGSLLWLGAVVPGFLGFLGMITFRYPEKLDDVAPIDALVSWRIVTRGTNIETVRSTILRCQEEMRKTPLFRYVIEVIIEAESRWDLLPTGDDIVYHRIPKSYVTPNDTKFKARALFFGQCFSDLPDDGWIVHLDDETQPTPSGIKGIARFIRNEEESRPDRPRVGQGAILYHRKWEKYPILTLADNVRTGDDFARFHFQHRLGRTVFGLHGSYIVVRNDVEKLVDFDFGPAGSITEDAMWALALMQQGVRAAWCEGYLEEQSTESVMDFIKQRSRWFQGLRIVAKQAPVKLRWRACIGINTALWTLAPFAALYTLIHFFWGFEVITPIRLMANLSYASFTTLYLTGLKANLDEHGIRNPAKRIGWHIAQLALTPVFSILEAASVAYALVTPVKGFHVVKKS